MHLTHAHPFYTQKYAAQEYKDNLWLLMTDLMNVEWKLHSLDTVFPHFDEAQIITIDVGVRHAEDKRSPKSIIAVAVIEGCYYNSGAIPLLQLNELRICHAFKLTEQKVPDASESLWFVFMPNEYLQNHGCKPQWRLSKGVEGNHFMVN